MPVNEYEIESRWAVRADVEEVAEILGDAESWTRWWPAAFLDVTEISCGDRGALRRKVRVHSKGWLPYTLRFDATAVDCVYPYRCTFRVRGDFEGACRCELRQEGELAHLAFDWRVAVRKPLVRYLSWLLRPLFAANHRWVMRQGVKSLKIEIERRRAERQGKTYATAPPGPTFPYGGRLSPLGRLWRSVTARSGAPGGAERDPC